MKPPRQPPAPDATVFDAAVARAHARFVAGRPAAEVLAPLLEALAAAGDGAWALVGITETGPDGTPRLRPLAEFGAPPQPPEATLAAGVPLHHDGLPVGALALAAPPDRAVLAPLAALVAALRRDESLRESERRLRLLVEKVDDVFWLGDRERTIYVSPAFERVWGLPVQALYGDTAAGMQMLHEDDREPARRLWATAFEGRAAQGQFRLRRPDGEVRWLHSRAFPVFDDAGAVARVVSVTTDVTDRELAEQARRISDERFRLLVENVPAVYWLGDGERTLYMSPAFEHLWGMARHELEADPDAALRALEPADREIVDTAMAATRRGEAVEFQHRVHRRDGSVRWVHTRAFPIFDDAGRVRLLAAVGTDITERKFAELALRDSEEKFRTLTESMAAAVFIAAGTQFRYVNSRAAEITGYAADELLRMSFFDIVHPDSRPLLQARMHARARGEPVPTRAEVKLRTRAGEERWADFSVEAVPLLGQTVLLGTAFDITPRKRAEAARAESERRLNATFEMAAVGIAHISPDGRFVRVNRKLCEVLGYAAEHLLVLRVQDVTQPPDLPANREYARRLLRGEPPGRPLEARYRRGDGSIVWVSYNAALAVEDGQPAYFIAVVEDITERKHAESALLAAQAAERANAAKTEFLSRMSHELRTPLNAVIGFAQLLQMDTRQPLADEQRARLRHIEDAGAHLLAMINDVLDLSRIEGGGMTLVLQEVALPALVQEAAALVATEARGRGVQIELAPDVMAPAERVCADAVRLRQVLVNLLSNAVKYNRAHGHVTVRWGAAADGDGVRLAVVDTGCGLTPQQRAHLFEPFNRLGAERRGIDGTGIGLVLTRRLVQLMGGTITVDSEPGVGSCFAVTLPAAAAGTTAATGDDAAAAAAPPAAAATPPRPVHTVLYVEDHDVNVELVAAALQLRPGCRLAVARSGREALALAAGPRPDLLLVDMHLGDMDGLELLRRLIAIDPAWDGVPRVALSADAMPAPIEAARQAGFRDYLTKPLDLAAFLRCIDAVVT